ncbi:GvpL/GvpF family gas vesicle protein [Streptomyces sp. HUAS TT7]|uniref:GvpL/GvpF family gas vesicle protein n=1 Tax=Streptomyces sp. HUAS TT7 TaxID=3447507 RepID=UPI003F65CFA3
MTWYARLSGEPGENVLNAAYLVPLDRSEDFVAAVRDFIPHIEGVRVELTGPWAPSRSPAGRTAGTAKRPAGGQEGREER